MRCNGPEMVTGETATPNTELTDSGQPPQRGEMHGVPCYPGQALEAVSVTYSQSAPPPSLPSSPPGTPMLGGGSRERRVQPPPDPFAGTVDADPQVVFPPVMAAAVPDPEGEDDASQDSDDSSEEGEDGSVSSSDSSVIPASVLELRRAGGRIVSNVGVIGGEEIWYQVDRPCTHWKFRVMFCVRELCYHPEEQRRVPGGCARHRERVAREVRHRNMAAAGKRSAGR